MIGDGHSVGVSAEVVEDLLGTAEGALGIDDPLLSVQGVQKGSEQGPVGQLGTDRRNLELILIVELSEGMKEFALEQ